jgi:hypothetical protein
MFSASWQSAEAVRPLPTGHPVNMITNVRSWCSICHFIPRDGNQSTILRSFIVTATEACITNVLQALIQGVVLKEHWCALVIYDQSYRRTILAKETYGEHIMQWPFESSEHLQGPIS